MPANDPRREWRNTLPSPRDPKVLEFLSALRDLTLVTGLELVGTECCLEAVDTVGLDGTYSYDAAHYILWEAKE